ncbi:cation transporter [Aceticella autotrophica]|uniref:Cation transporter n=1 Tax=Aceticella autotrophica TaxID=2755338 RepID=A0A975AVL0_9THEO|nr:cation diffusion facilitator family transporter [Aceticella autotrophica]QSZ27289.1 cation transporter [Aceticella autotrophica]
MDNKHANHESEVHHHNNGHSHTHGVVDPWVFTSQRGIWAVKWSFVILIITALFQIVVAYISGSVALLADTVHNIGDAATALPLWIAFTVAQWKPNRRFTYGYGKVEDLAGVAVVLVILASAVVAIYESVDRFFHPRPIEHLWAVIAAALIGFLGNEIVAIFRMKVGREIGSAALIADGYHARIDGLTSLSVLLGVVGVWMGYPIVDSLVGFIISLVILRIVWESGKSVFVRMIDGVDVKITDEILHGVKHVEGVKDVTEVRVRWLGHRLHAEVNITVEPDISVKEGHEIAKEVRHQLLHHLKYLSNAMIHIDPVGESGEESHSFINHTHDGLSEHSHF